jgi:hypothetical protein
LHGWLDVVQRNWLRRHGGPADTDHRKARRLNPNFRTLGTLEESDYTWADRGIRCLTATFLGLLECASHARLDRGYARGASENID